MHGKFILLDNFYLLIPLCKLKKDILPIIINTVLKLILSIDRNQIYKFIDEINMNAIFNDIDLVKPLFISLLNSLKEMGLEE